MIFLDMTSNVNTNRLMSQKNLNEGKVLKERLKYLFFFSA